MSYRLRHACESGGSVSRAQTAMSVNASSHLCARLLCNRFLCTLAALDTAGHELIVGPGSCVCEGR